MISIALCKTNWLMTLSISRKGRLISGVGAVKELISVAHFVWNMRTYKLIAF